MDDLQFGIINAGEVTDNYKTPKVSIGGVNIHLQNFTWALTAGTFPYETHFLTNNATTTKQLLQLENPTYLEIEVYGGCDGNATQLKKRIEKVYLLEPNQTDPFHIRWTIADSRYAWRGLKIFDCFNKTRTKNQKGISVKAPDTSPQILREQFDTFKVGRYLPWSVHIDGSPFTVYEMLTRILAASGIYYKDTTSGQKGSYIIENVEFNGRDFCTGIAYLLNLSRLQMGINIDGSVYIYSLDFFDESELNLVKKFEKIPRISPGVFFKQNLKNERPKAIFIFFEKKKEVRLVESSSQYLPANNDGKIKLPLSPVSGVYTQDDIDNRRVIGCENVIPVPYPIQIDGVWKNVGEWVPMWKYLTSLSLSGEDILNQIGTYFFSSHMERWFCKLMGLDLNEANERYISHIVTNIKQHYLQTYQLDPYFMNRIDFWEPRRVGVVNNMDHYTPPSPVFADMCYVPEFRHPQLARRTALWSNHVYNWRLDVDDPLRQSPTGATINLINQELGVFQIAMPPNLEKVIMKIYPFCLNPLPYPSLSNTPSCLDECNIISPHRFESIISLVWAVDQDDSPSWRKHKMFHYSISGGLGPEIYHLCDLEYARYAFNGTTQYNAQGDEMAENEGIITALANVEMAKIFNSFRDRYSGHCTFAGFIDTQLAGTIKAIAYNFSPGSGLCTIIDARNIPPAKTYEQSLNQRQIDYLRKHITRGDNANEVGRR